MVQGVEAGTLPGVFNRRHLAFLTNTWLFWSAVDLELVEVLQLLLQLCPEIRHQPGPDNMRPIDIAIAKGNSRILEIWRKYNSQEVEDANTNWKKESPAKFKGRSNGIQQLYRTFPDCNIPKEEFPSKSPRLIHFEDIDLVETCLPTQDNTLRLSTIGDTLKCKGHSDKAK